MWFLTLIPSAAWKYLGLLAAAGALYAYADLKATHREHAKCEAAAVAAQNAANKQDTQAQQEVSTQDAQVVNQLKDQKRVDDAKIEWLEKEISKKPIPVPGAKPSKNGLGPCVFPPDADGPLDGVRGKVPVPRARNP